MDAEEVEYLELDVVAIRRQEVNLALLRHGIVADGLQALHRSGVVDAHLLCEVVNALHAAIPYDVLNVNIVTYQGLYVVVNVDDTHKSVTLLSEIIKEGRVLTEWVITIVREITR